jgi:hypothetical protein
VRRPRIVIGVVAAISAAVLALLGLGIVAVLAGVLAAGLLAPTSLIGGDGGDPMIHDGGGGGTA